jgi:CoA-binding domain
MTEISEFSEAARAPARWPAFILGRSLILIGLVAETLVIVALSVLAGIAYHLAAYHVPGNALDFAKVGAVVALIRLVPHLQQRSTSFVTQWTGEALRRKFYLWTMSFLCLLALGFVGKISGVYSRGAIALFYVSGLPLLILYQHLWMQIVRYGFSTGRIAMRRALLLGSPAKVAEFKRKYPSNECGLIIAQTIMLPDNALEPTAAGDAVLRRALGDALQAVRSSHLDDVFLLVPWSATHAINRCADSLITSPVSIHLGPEEIFDRFSDASLSKFGFRLLREAAKRPNSRPIGGLRRVNAR